MTISSTLPRPRMLVHEDLLLTGTTTAIAGASLACKYFFLSKNDSWLGKAPYFVAGLAGWSAAQYAYKALRFYSKRRFLIAPPFHPAIGKHKQAFENAFAKINRHLACDMIFDPRDATQHTVAFKKRFFINAISYGTCAGQADILQQQASKLPSTSCRELLQSLDHEELLEEIFYRQMMHSVLSRMKGVQEFYDDMKSKIGLPGEQRAGASQLSQIYKNQISTINIELHPAGYTTGELFAITSPSVVYLEKFREILQSLPHGQSTGQIHGETNTLFANGQFIAGHTLFFKYAEGSYSFYDPICCAEGLYEYKDEKSFIEALRSQFIEYLGNNAQVRFASA